jgi:hypothetical protein
LRPPRPDTPKPRPHDPHIIPPFAASTAKAATADTNAIHDKPADTQNTCDNLDDNTPNIDHEIDADTITHADTHSNPNLDHETTADKRTNADTTINDADTTHDPIIIPLESIDTPSTIPLDELRDLIGDNATPPPPFQYEPGIIEAATTEEPLPIISIYKFSEQPQMRKMREIRINIKCQGDTGANVGATNDRRILWNYRTLETPIPIITYSKDDDEGISFQAIGVGQCKTISADNTVMYWTMLHTPDSTGTIISPDKYMMDNSEVQSFNHIGNKNGTGAINFEDDNGYLIASIDMSRHSDGLWYTTNPILMPPPSTNDYKTRDISIAPPYISKAATARQSPLTPIDETTPLEQLKPTVKLTKSLEQLELWHQRMGHPAPRALQATQRVVEGIPNLPNNNSIFSCPFCDMAKLRKADKNKNSLREVFIPGTSFHMDLGFIRGPSNLEDVVKNGATPNKTIVKSRDGYEAYLLIIDAATRYIWVFLLKGKHPPIATIAQFLQKHGSATKGKITTTPGGLLDKSKSFATACKERGYECDTMDFDLNFEDTGLETPRHTVRTDNGGELAGSTAFCQTIAEHGYLVEPTAPDASNQNGLAERPHKTLKERVRCLLYTAGLGILFWADALLHSVWLYNRTFHSRIDKTPFQAYTKRIPTLDGLITFGCRVTPKKAGRRNTATDPNSYDGIFLGYRATQDNIRYWDTNAQRERSATHVAKDEVQYGDPPDKRSPASKHLIEVITGTPHTQRRTDILLDDKTKDTPTNYHITLTDPGAINDHNLMTIDDSPLPFTASAAKIATADTNTIHDKKNIPADTPSTCDNQGDNTSNIDHEIDADTIANADTHDVPNIDYETTADTRSDADTTNNDADTMLPTKASAAKVAVKHGRKPKEVLTHELLLMDITTNIHEPAVSETLPLQGGHPTLGLIAEQHPEYIDTITLTRCDPGTISHKQIRRWKSRLRGSTIRMVDDVTITDIAQFTETIRLKRLTGQLHVKIQFANPRWSAMSGEGLPTLQFDQLNVITHHLNAINNDGTTWNDPVKWPPLDNENIIAAIHKGLALPKLTRRRLLDTPEWPKFKDSEWVQLNKYNRQGMFGEPCPRPLNDDVVVLPWVWSYLYKIDPVLIEDVAKSRGTCNGGPRHGKVITIAETYAACVEQPAHRLMWALIAALNFVGLGIDVGNAFAEAPPPKDPFFMQADKQFREWWTQCLGHPPIPDGWVIPILKNLQGHPEGPRLWDNHIRGIMVKNLGFKTTTHEQCFYYKRTLTDGLILILRQVDDFIIAAKSMTTCQAIRQEIQGYMANPLNDLGIIKRFNGVDVVQTKHYVKIHCETYLARIVTHHGWTNEKASNKPVPMKSDSTYLAILQLAEGPDTEKERDQLEDSMGFSYRQAIGELIFAHTICRIDISIAVITLSQYSANPAKEHYQAVKAVFVYLWHTKDEGIYYWRPEARNDLPDMPLPETTTDPERLKAFLNFDDPLITKGAGDSTWASDRKHRRSMGGLVFMLAAGAIYYRTRLFPTVSQSSTEAEFNTMVDAGKAALYIRSILEEIGIDQILPTAILADNRGARQLSNAHQPTRRTRHVDMKHFVILQWTEEERIHYSEVSSNNNFSDSLTKPTGRVKFYEHNDIMMGRRRPIYVKDMKAFKLVLSSTYSSLQPFFFQ